MENPFQLFDERLKSIETLLSKLSSMKNAPQETSSNFNKIPIQEIFKSKLLSKRTFYDHVGNGTIKLFKLGGRSYVDAEQFNNCFREAKISKV